LPWWGSWGRRACSGSTRKRCLGLVYLFTGGLCLLGTIYDVVTYKDLALRYNRDVALDVAETVRQVYDGESEAEDA